MGDTVMRRSAGIGVWMLAVLMCCGGGAAFAAEACPAVKSAGAMVLILDTCRDLQRRLAKVPGGNVQIAIKSFLDPRFECVRDGCVVTLSGLFSALGQEGSADEWLGEYLKQRGWSPTLSHDADGPDGTVYALHKPGALCIVEGRWNHWHDEDGEGHTDDAYTFTVSCGAAERDPPRLPE